MNWMQNYIFKCSFSKFTKDRANQHLLLEVTTITTAKTTTTTSTATGPLLLLLPLAYY